MWQFYGLLWAQFVLMTFGAECSLAKAFKTTLARKENHVLSPNTRFRSRSCHQTTRKSHQLWLLCLVHISLAMLSLQTISWRLRSMFSHVHLAYDAMADIKWYHTVSNGTRRNHIDNLQQIQLSLSYVSRASRKRILINLDVQRTPRKYNLEKNTHWKIQETVV